MIFFSQNSNYSTKNINSAKDAHWDNVKETVIRCKIDLLANARKKLKNLPAKEKNEKKLTIIINSIDNWLKPHTFEEIVKAPLKDIKAILNDYNNGKWTPSQRIKNLKRITPEELFKKLYNYYRDNYGKEFITKIGVNVCPYCNRSYINYDSNTNISTPLDHFYVKKYYFLMLSFENLIPCCPFCNSNKNDNEKELLSPYDEKYNTDSVIKFSYIPSSNDGLEVVIESKEKIMQNNIDIFHLYKIYNYHTDIIKELEYKRKCYSQVYIESIKNIHKEICNFTQEEIYYGVGLTCSNYYLRPLSKFTKDIIDCINNAINEESKETK